MSKPSSTSQAAKAGGAPEELVAFTRIAEALAPLDPTARERVFRTVSMFFELHGLPGRAQPDRDTVLPGSSVAPSAFSDDRSPSAKEFLLQKRPQTDIDRVVVLAYYLTNYREQRHFKTLDLSKLNTDAAQVKFSNASLAVDNAAKAGYLVPAGKGMKQISASGEIYVEALPDRVAARDAARLVRPRRQRRRGAKAGDSSNGDAQGT